MLRNPLIVLASMMPPMLLRPQRRWLVAPL